MSSYYNSICALLQIDGTNVNLPNIQTLVVTNNFTCDTRDIFLLAG